MIENKQIFEDKKDVLEKILIYIIGVGLLSFLPIDYFYHAYYYKKDWWLVIGWLFNILNILFSIFYLAKKYGFEIQIDSDGIKFLKNKQIFKEIKKTDVTTITAEIIYKRKQRELVKLTFGSSNGENNAFLSSKIKSIKNVLLLLNSMNYPKIQNIEKILKDKQNSDKESKFMFKILAFGLAFIFIFAIVIMLLVT